MATEPHQAGQEAGASFCNWHPDTETRLHCSQCGKSICTLCLVQVPVGIRCRECGRPERLPTYDVQPTYLIRALGTAVVIALVGGVIWGVVDVNLGVFPFVSWLIGMGVGYGASELIGLSVNRKRGAPLTWIAAGAVGVAGIIHLFFLGPFSSLSLLLDLIIVGIAMFIAWSRLR